MFVRLIEADLNDQSPFDTQSPAVDEVKAIIERF